MFAKLSLSLLSLFLFFTYSYSAPKTIAEPGPLRSSGLTIKTVSKVEGYSVKKKPIVSYRFGSGGRTVLYLGVFHGDEGQGKDLLDRMMDEIHRHPEWTKNSRVVVVPVVNPDGLAKKKRTNARGVDLNRNFQTRDWTRRHHLKKCYPGTRKPEPETRTVMKIVKKYKPDVIVTIHAFLACNNYDGPGGQIAFQMAKRNHYKVRSYIGYETPGSFGTFAGKERNVPVITLELSKATLEQSWAVHGEALLSAIRFPIKSAGTDDIFTASEQGETQQVADSVSNGVPVNVRDEDGWTPLMTASWYGRYETARCLLQNGADPNMGDRFGGTPLQFAAQNDRADIVELLLDNGASINAKDSFGNTALMEAGRNANLTSLKLLLSRGADIHMRDHEGKTVFMDTARRGYLLTMQELIAAGADINEKDQFGRTALMEAAAKDYPNMARRLIELGANLDVADARGLTAVKEARINNNRGILSMLKKAIVLQADGEPAWDRTGK